MLTFCADYLRQVFRNKLDFFAAAKASSSFPPPNLPEIAFAGRILGHIISSLFLCSFFCSWFYFNYIMALLHSIGRGVIFDNFNLVSGFIICFSCSVSVIQKLMFINSFDVLIIMQ